MRIAVIQTNSSADKHWNLEHVTQLVEQAVESSTPDFVILPEMSACIAGGAAPLHRSAEDVVDGSWSQELSKLAKRLRINLHSGSSIEVREGRFYNTSVVYDREGRIVGRYSKIHRFDVDLPNGTSFRESDIVERGGSLEVVEIEGVNVGLAICYDLRFPELFRKLAEAGAELIVLPSAFTFQTGADHWEVLIRARAIETGTYLAAPAQYGSFECGKYMNFGHSIVVDPWGLVIAQASNRPGFAAAEIDPGYLTDVRAKIPVARHRVLV